MSTGIDLAPAGDFGALISALLALVLGVAVIGGAAVTGLVGWLIHRRRHLERARKDGDIALGFGALFIIGHGFLFPTYLLLLVFGGRHSATLDKSAASEGSHFETQLGGLRKSSKNVLVNDYRVSVKRPGSNEEIVLDTSQELHVELAFRTVSVPYLSVGSVHRIGAMPRVPASVLVILWGIASVLAACWVLPDWLRARAATRRP